MPRGEKSDNQTCPPVAWPHTPMSREEKSENPSLSAHAMHIRTPPPTRPDPVSRSVDGTTQQGGIQIDWIGSPWLHGLLVGCSWRNDRHLPPLVLCNLVSLGKMFSQKRRTNLENTGLISTDRSNKATLLLTIPCFKIKVVCNGFIFSNI